MFWIRLIGIAAAVYSLTALIKGGFHLEFGPLLSQGLDLIERQAQPFFELVEPWIRAQLVWLQGFLNLQLQLFPHWKHVLVLIWLYFSSQTFANFANAEDTFEAAQTLLAGVISFAIAFVAGVVVGTLPLENAATSGLILIIPVAAIFLDDVIGKILLVSISQNLSGSRLQIFRSEVRFCLLRLGLGLVLIAIRFAVPVAAAPNLSLVLLGAYIVILALTGILQGLPLLGTDFDSGAAKEHVETGKRILIVFGATLFTVLAGLNGF